VPAEEVGDLRGLRLRGHLRRVCAPPPVGFTLGQPLGTGGQAIPWGFENNVVACNKRDLRREGHHEAAGQARRRPAVGRRPFDRSQNRYGISTRGSKSWATIHPGFMTQYTREGAIDDEFNGSELIAESDSDKAIEFTKTWIDMQHRGTDIVDNVRLPERHRRSR
jgi:multiple sugar transport system substrate-binding protein